MQGERKKQGALIAKRQGMPRTRDPSSYPFSASSIPLSKLLPLLQGC